MMRSFWLSSAPEEPPGALGQLQENLCLALTHLPVAEEPEERPGEEPCAG